MSMTTKQIITFLDATGHLRHPNGQQEQAIAAGPCNAAIDSAEVANAIESYQLFELERVDRLALKHHGRALRLSNKEIGPATIEAMETPRCIFPDYGPEVEAAVGNGGGWVGCHGYDDGHCVKIYEDTTNLPSFLAPYFEEVKERVRLANADIGIRIIWTEERSEANIVSMWVTYAPGWIGLAIVGQREQCGGQIWAKFSARYQPANILNEHTTLKLHEHGHNWGLSHSRGGIMNPSIVQGLAPTWRGDQSESLLVKMYSGDPIEPPPIPGGEYWTHQGYKSNKGRTEWVQLANPIEIKDLGQ